MQIHKHHLEFLREAQEVFRENPKQVTYIDEDSGLIALRESYNDVQHSVIIYEIGPQVAFFANILDTVIKVY